MKIVIRNYLSGSLLLEREPRIWDAIVILDRVATPTDFVAKQARRHLYLRFDDIESSMDGKRIPSTDDVRSAVQFSSESENILVCCRAGQSRSAAIAFVLCYRLLGADAACRLLDPTRHSPNSLVVELGSQVIDEPQLLETFRQWRMDNRVRLSDYIDDIERECDELERQGARNRILGL
jgi:predicted protein tyrosine phosphatase